MVFVKWAIIIEGFGIVGELAYERTTAYFCVCELVELDVVAHVEWDVNVSFAFNEDGGERS